MCSSEDFTLLFLFVSISFSAWSSAVGQCFVVAIWPQVVPFLGWQGRFCHCHPHDNVERDTGPCLRTALAFYTHLAGSSCSILKQPYLPVPSAYLGKCSYPTASLQPQWFLTFSILRCSVCAWQQFPNILLGRQSGPRHLPVASLLLFPWFC